MYKLIYEKFHSLLTKNSYKINNIYYSTLTSIRLVKYIKCINGNKSIVIEIPDKYHMLLPVSKNKEINYKEISDIDYKLSDSSIRYINNSKNGIKNNEISYFFENNNGVYVNDAKYFQIIQNKNNFNNLEDELHTIKHELEESENIINEDQLEKGNDSNVILIFKETREIDIENSVDIENSDVFICIDIKYFHKNIQGLLPKHAKVFDTIESNKNNIRKERINKVEFLLNKKITELQNKYKNFTEKEMTLKKNIINLQNIMDNCDDINDNEKAATLYNKTKNAIKDINDKLEELYKDLNIYMNKTEKCLI